MQYIYKDAEGNEVGPVAQNVVISLIEGGEITESTPIRNSLLSDFAEAQTHRALAIHFKRKDPEATRRSNETEYEFKRRLEKQKNSQQKNSAMVRTSTIGEASTVKRLFSVIIDSILLWIVLVVLIFCSLSRSWNSPIKVMQTVDEQLVEGDSRTNYSSFLNFTEEQTYTIYTGPPPNEYEILLVCNSRLGTLVSFRIDRIIYNLWLANLIWGIIIAIYYVFMLGYFAQTIGMRICGCVLVKENREDPSEYEINYRDAFNYFIMFMLLGWTYIFTMFFTKKQGLHCKLIRVRVADVASNS